MAENPNIITTDEDGNEDPDTSVEVNDLIPGGGSGSGGIDVSDSGKSIASDATAIDLTAALAAVDNDGTVTIEVEQDQIDGWVDQLLQVASGSNLSLAYDDANGTLSIGSANGNGLPQLSDRGVVLSSQMPDLAVTETYTVADETERLSLSVQEGDIAIQQDEDQSYIFTGGDASSDSNWSAIVTPPAPVDTVFGRTGDVSAQDGDYTASQVGAVPENDFGLSAILEGAEADKPAAGTAGRYYFATDTEVFYRDNGTSWVAKGGRGSSSDPVPGTTHLEAVSTGDLSVTDSSDLQEKILSSWGTVYEATDAGMDQAIQDLNAADFGDFLLTPDATFTVDTAWVADQSKAIASHSGTKHGTVIKASSNLSSRLVDMQGGHLCQGIEWDGQTNVTNVIEATASYSNIHHEQVTSKNPGAGGWAIKTGSGGNVDGFNASFINCDFTDGGKFDSDYWVHGWDTEFNTNADDTTSLEVSRMKSCSFAGGAIAGTATSELCNVGKFIDVLTFDRVAFEGADVGDGSPPPTHIDWGGETDTTGNEVKGGGVVRCRFINNLNSTSGDVGIEVRQTDGCQFAGNFFNGFDSAVSANPANGNFNSGEFGPISANNVTNPYSGFSTNPAAGDKRLHGGSFTTS